MEKIVNFIKKRPLLVVLWIVLTVISVGMIKPDFYLVGWDNYSSYFNIKNSFFRTLFATWREYRGLGVPSDAEVTDVFRIFLQMVLSIFVKEELLDQLYFVFSLWAGVLAVYSLARLLFKDTNKKESDKWLDTIGFISVFFYLFNMNTLSVFYSPMIPFVNRFWGLPALLWSMINWDKKKTKGNIVIVLLVVFFSSGSYITPTVMITNLMALFMFGLFYFGLKKTLMYETMYVLLNAFWLLPFINYVLEKSAIVPLARTFVEINESMLNKPDSFFSLGRQSILWPSFLEMTFPSLSGQPYWIHPILGLLRTQVWKYGLYLFPLVYVLGSVVVLTKMKKNKKLLWLVAWIFIFLFLSVKGYGPIGFLYTFLEKNIPFFEMIFRIGDTKFHSYISLGGSLLAGLMVVKLLTWFKGKLGWVVKGGIVMVVVLYGYLFQAYFTGQFIGFYCYNRIPEAHKEIANIINSDKGDGRVLHLPMSAWHEYWRSFSWGYIGSAWYNFLLSHPYIDKTFEPASMENSYLDSQIIKVINKFDEASEDEKYLSAIDFFRLLNKVGVNYLVADETIQSTVEARNMVYTAPLYSKRVMDIAEYMKKVGLVELIGSYDVNLEKEVFPYYKKLYPVSLIGYEDSLPDNQSVKLYKLGSSKMFENISRVEIVDRSIDELLETDLIFDDTNLIQTEDEVGAIYPFKNQDFQVELNGNEIRLKSESDKSGQYKVLLNNRQVSRQLVSIKARLTGNELSIEVFDDYLPNIGSKEYKKEISQINFVLNSAIENYWLTFGDESIPLEDLEINKELWLGDFMVDPGEIGVSLWQKNDSVNLVLGEIEKNVVVGNIAVVGDETMGRFRVRLDSEVTTNEREARDGIEKEILTKGVLPYGVDVCIYQGESGQCLNRTKQYKLKGSKGEIFEVDLNSSLVKGLDGEVIIRPMIFDGLINHFQVRQVTFNRYKKVDSNLIYLNFEDIEEGIDVEGELVIDLPRLETKYSYSFNGAKNMIDMPGAKCSQDNFRSIRSIDGGLVSYIDYCDVYYSGNFLLNGRMPYLFASNMWVDSGQQPVMELDRKEGIAFKERLGLYQGLDYFRDESIGQDLNNINYKTVSRLFEPDQLDVNGISEAAIKVFQSTHNRGLMALGDMVMMEYPRSWYEVKLEPTNISQKYVGVRVMSYEKVLPSLWRLEVQGETDGLGLVRFGQGYDTQWGLYENLRQMVLGKSVARNYRCDGWANCFELNVKKDMVKNYWVLYWPEVLATMGWIVSLSTSLALVFLIKSKKAARK